MTVPELPVLSDDELDDMIACLAQKMTPVPGFIVSWDRGDEKVLAALLDLQRTRAAAAAVEKLTYASDDGSEYEHDHHGYPTCPGCPACWATNVRKALRGEA